MLWEPPNICTVSNYRFQALSPLSLFRLRDLSLCKCALRNWQTQTRYFTSTLKYKYAKSNINFFFPCWNPARSPFHHAVDQSRRLICTFCSWSHSAKKLSIYLNFSVFLLLLIFSFTPLWSEKTLRMMTILSLSTCLVNYHSILEIAHFMCTCKEFFYFWLAECSVSVRSTQSMSLKSATFSVFCWAALSIIDHVCMLWSITSFNSINVCFIMGTYSQSSLRWLDSGFLCDLNENAALLAQAFEH